MVSLRAASRSARAGTRDAAVRASRSASARQARQAAAQFAPVARSLRMSTRRGTFTARAWAAPRVERTGRLVQERAAPAVAAMLTAAARRIEPPRSVRGRRWPRLAAVSAMLAGGGAAAALLLSRRSAGGAMRAPETAPPEGEHDQTDAGVPATDVNARARTS